MHLVAPLFRTYWIQLIARWYCSSSVPWLGEGAVAGAKLSRSTHMCLTSTASSTKLAAACFILCVVQLLWLDAQAALKINAGALLSLCDREGVGHVQLMSETLGLASVLVDR